MSFVALVDGSLAGFDPKALAQRMSNLAPVIFDSEVRLPEVLRTSISESTSQGAISFEAGMFSAAGAGLLTGVPMPFEANLPR
jgi:hypothetical protein